MSMSKKLQIVIIDNHDSFTGNLYQLFDENPNCDITIIPNDKVEIQLLINYDKIVLSPGPDIPSNYPILFNILNTYANTKSILGICLGHQTLVEYFGGTLYNLPIPLHGQKKEIHILNQHILFKNIPTKIDVGLYHSWAADPLTIPKELEITAKTSDGIIMAIKHRTLDIQGVQFHPESYMTDYGRKIINQWIDEKN
ncbi:para-aminobenzoate synthetase component 2 [Myroides guanonis]|uniref:Para-aminobenzoate synthetase component 2 n=2 Tax=Myroides guanonis TaxID=1150112 RepID=A0A1I3KMX9_9FLAO|nr:para-aminobenzoate synthetase component 2 [Myroides guanonis]